MHMHNIDLPTFLPQTCSCVPNSCMQLHCSSVSGAWECVRSLLRSFTTDKRANTGKDAKGRYIRGI